MQDCSEPERINRFRLLSRTDLFFLLVYALNRPDADNDWYFARCREVQASPNGHLDLWGREHGKSSILTFALTIQDILNDPEITVGIFSHTKPIAKAFLRQIKREFEANDRLKRWFPDILWDNPRKESPKWTEDEGIVVKRKGNPKEATVEASGLVDGQPTSRHYKLRVYDDVVVTESVSSPEMMAKTTRQFELSDNLGAIGGVFRMAGTRYHFSDTYGEVIKRGMVKPRIHPATVDGTETGEPVLMSREVLAAKRIAQGPYTFHCLPFDAPVLMADLSQRRIVDVMIGEEVVGYAFPRRAKTRITRSRVIARSVRRAEVWEFTLASGRTACCTADHKWYTGRRGPDVGGTDNHYAYATIDCVSRKGVAGNAAHLVSFYDPRKVFAPYDAQAAAWLGGFYDGEGSASGCSVHFHQSEKYPPILDRLEASLAACGFDFGCHRFEHPRRTGWLPARDYYLRGGRQTHMRFLNICRPAKAQPVIDSIYKRDARCFHAGKNNRDKIVSKRSLGEMDVVNIQTETGNYIAYGYATKNCQMLLNPRGDGAQTFQKSWIKYLRGDTRREGLNVYILCDPANEKRKTNDYTCFWVIGLDAAKNYLALDVIRDRMNLTERTNKLFELHEQWQPILVGYEKYGMQSDIQHIQHVQNERNYRFTIHPLGGQTPKPDRIKRLIPLFEQGRMWLRPVRMYADIEGNVKNLIDVFIEEEFAAFPVMSHDDMLDCLARIVDPEFPVRWPYVGAAAAPPEVLGAPYMRSRR